MRGETWGGMDRGCDRHGVGWRHTKTQTFRDLGTPWVGQTDGLTKTGMPHSRLWGHGGVWEGPSHKLIYPPSLEGSRVWKQEERQRLSQERECQTDKL